MIEIRKITYSHFYNGLTRTQKASYEYSLVWKRISSDLFKEAIQQNSVKAFKKAVRWCGGAGNVSRSVSSDDFDSFASYLWGNKGNIKNGVFSLSDVKRFGGKTPVSWTSKICHIISPSKYPVIYDSKVREALEIRSINAFWNLMLFLRDKGPIKPSPWELDSAIWASELDNQ